MGARVGFGERVPLRDGTLDQCMRDQRMAVAWSPLGGGRLMAAGTEADGSEARLIAVLDALAANHGVSRATCLPATCCLSSTMDSLKSNHSQ